MTAIDIASRGYWYEQFRRSAFDFDSQSVRPYFPYAQVEAGVLETAAKIFKIEFRRSRLPAGTRRISVFEVVDGGRLWAASISICAPRRQGAREWHLNADGRGWRTMTTPAVKRVYEPPGDSDGTRILVDRLWPRGMAKEKARIDLWLKDIAPSDALRKQFHGKPDDWAAFCAAYTEELAGAAAQAAARELLDRLRSGPVTLLYAARDEHHNNAVALKEWLEERGPGRG